MARLMRGMGGSGSVLRKRRSYTFSRKHAFRSRGLVRRNFRTYAPDRVWFSYATRIHTR